MSETRYDVVVIGGGPGGYAAAFHAADHGLHTALIDQESRLGGVCLLRGCIPSKALLHVARVLTEVEEANAWGIHFEKPRLDLEVLRTQVNAVVSKLAQGVQALASSRNVTVFHARAAFKNPTALELTGAGDTRELRFKHAILATGSKPVMPPPLKLDDKRVMDSTGALHLDEIPRRLLVIGGGYIGLELATVYDALGTEVTIVEGLPRLLNGADPDLVQILHKRLQSRVKAVQLNTIAEQLNTQDDGIAVTLKNPDKTFTEVFDQVLVAVGRRPQTEHMGLEHTGVKRSADGFVEVDAQMRTGEPGILAIGDVVGEPLLAHKASHQGRIAAKVIAGKQVTFDAVTTPAVIFTDPEIAWCGITEEAAKASGQRITTVRFPWAASGRAATVGRHDGLTKMILDPETGRILGVGICGVGAGELIAEGVLAIEMGAVAEDVAASIHPHPTLTETIMEAAQLFDGQATHLYRRRPS